MTALIDTAKIAEITGLKREYVTDKLTKRPDFPKPVINRTQRLRRWKESDVMAWLKGEQQSTRPTRGSKSRAAA